MKHLRRRGDESGIMLLRKGSTKKTIRYHDEIKRPHEKKS
jgi:hypothetical protein